MNRSPTPNGMFVGVLRIVRHIIIIYVTHHRKPSTTSSQTVRNIIVTRPQLVYFVIVTHSENKNPLFALQKPYFCTPKTPFLHAKKGFLLSKKGGAAQQKRATRKTTTRRSCAKHAHPTPQQHYT